MLPSIAKVGYYVVLIVLSFFVEPLFQLIDVVWILHRFVPDIIVSGRCDTVSGTSKVIDCIPPAQMN